MATYKKYLIMAGIFLFLCLFMGVCGYSQSKIVQAQVISITKNKKHRVECTALSTAGDTIYIRYGFSGWKGKRKSIQPGTWLTLYASYKNRYGDWYCRKIVIQIKK